MTTYVMLANWTEQGILKAKDSPRRLDAAKKALKDMSGEIKSFYQPVLESGEVRVAAPRSGSASCSKPSRVNAVSGCSQLAGSFLLASQGPPLL